VPDRPRDPEGGLRVSIGVAKIFVRAIRPDEGALSVLVGYHFQPAARLSAMATSGPTVRAIRRARERMEVVMTGRPLLEVVATNSRRAGGGQPQ
jgi:hypothetical protein